MKPNQANANLSAALPGILRALEDFRNSSSTSQSFCYEIDPGRAHLLGTADLIRALRDLQRHVNHPEYR